MAITETKGVVGGGPGNGSGLQKRTAATARRTRSVSDKTIGIPQSELTPTVKSTVMSLMEQLESLKDELFRSRERIIELENMADEDPLVPVLNRRGFERELDRAIAYAKRYNSSLGMIFIDMDGFKTINDIFGHAAGDAVLRHVGQFLVDRVRRSDLVGRLGGDEFAIALHNTNLTAVNAKALQLAEQLKNEKFIFDGNKIYLSMTAGSAELLPEDGADDLLARADHSMYQRKRTRDTR